jgi:hypothetical protein
MSFAQSSTLGWLLIGVTGLAAVGCAPAADQPIDALPWSKTVIRRETAAVRNPTGVSAEAAAPLDARELQFRDRVVNDCLEELRRVAARPAVVRAVQTANSASWQSRQQIDETDLNWRQTPGTDAPLFQRYLKNPCADLLRQAKRTNPSYVELFVMDNKGCIVAETDKTSDYWQGDEAKWIECFNGANGRVHVGDVEYDQSTRSYVVQISVPLRDERGKTIGVMTASVSTGRRH